MIHSFVAPFVDVPVVSILFVVQSFLSVEESVTLTVLVVGWAVVSGEDLDAWCVDRVVST